MWLCCGAQHQAMDAMQRGCVLPALRVQAVWQAAHQHLMLAHNSHFIASVEMPTQGDQACDDDLAHAWGEWAV